MTVVEFVLAGMLLLSPTRDHRPNAIAIAQAIDADKPLFKDDVSKLKTSALIVAIAFRESSFRNDAVSKTGDHCLMQVNRRPELAEDPVACVRVGIAMLRESMRICPAHPLAFYAEGPRGCDSPRAQRISRDRIAVAHWIASHVRSL